MPTSFPLQPFFAAFAQTASVSAGPADLLGGASGWAGAGLLGAVLSWLLLKHLPAKDTQIEKLVDSKDEAVREARVDYLNECKEQRKACTEDAKEGRASQERQLATALSHASKIVHDEREAGERRLTSVLGKMDEIHRAQMSALIEIKSTTDALFAMREGDGQ
jgi:hypothetical protein